MGAAGGDGTAPEHPSSSFKPHLGVSPLKEPITPPALNLGVYLPAPGCLYKILIKCLIVTYRGRILLHARREKPTVRGCVFRRLTSPLPAWEKRGAPLFPPAIRPHLPQHGRDTRVGRPHLGSSRLPIRFCVPSPGRQRREGSGLAPFAGRWGRYVRCGDEWLVLF